MGERNSLKATSEERGGGNLQDGGEGRTESAAMPQDQINNLPRRKSCSICNRASRNSNTGVLFQYVEATMISSRFQIIEPKQDWTVEMDRR